MADSVYRDSLYQGSFAGVLGWQYNPPETLPSSQIRYTQGSANRSDTAVEPELSRNNKILKPARIFNLPRREQDSHRNRQIEGSPGLANIGRREIDQQLGPRHLIPIMLNRYRDPGQTLFDPLIGKTRDLVTQTAGHADLHPYSKGIYTQERRSI